MRQTVGSRPQGTGTPTPTPTPHHQPPFPCLVPVPAPQPFRKGTENSGAVKAPIGIPWLKRRSRSGRPCMPANSITVYAKASHN